MNQSRSKMTFFPKEDALDIAEFYFGYVDPRRNDPPAPESKIPEPEIPKALNPPIYCGESIPQADGE